MPRRRDLSKQLIRYIVIVVCGITYGTDISATPHNPKIFTTQKDRIKRKKICLCCLLSTQYLPNNVNVVTSVKRTFLLWKVFLFLDYLIHRKYNSTGKSSFVGLIRNIPSSIGETFFFFLLSGLFIFTFYVSFGSSIKRRLNPSFFSIFFFLL